MNVSWWITLILTGAVLMIAAESGFRYGRRARDEEADRQSSPAGLLVGAILALLGLLLGFSFSMVGERLDVRRQLVLADANAIATAYMRAEMIPPPHAERVRELLRGYVSFRMKADTREELSVALDESVTYHDDLWREAVEVARAGPSLQTTALFVNSLNEMIDLHESRASVALYERMPRAVKAVLYTAAILAMGIVGYSAGLARTRAGAPVVALVVAVASVMTLIIELDEPLASEVFVSQRAMMDVAEWMGAHESSGPGPR